MDITIPIKKTLIQLSETIDQFTDLEYSLACSQLSGASIGQHCRHIIELFKELLTGYENGIICYDKRKRDILLETKKGKAIIEIEILINSIQIPDKNLLLSIHLNKEQPKVWYIETNYFRELLYNLEHCVHHMALIRIGIKEITNLELPKSFGVASSTIKYRNDQCAQ